MNKNELDHPKNINNNNNNIVYDNSGILSTTVPLTTTTSVILSTLADTKSEKLNFLPNHFFPQFNCK